MIGNFLLDKFYEDIHSDNADNLFYEPHEVLKLLAAQREVDCLIIEDMKYKQIDSPSPIVDFTNTVAEHFNARLDDIKKAITVKDS